MSKAKLRVQAEDHFILLVLTMDESKSIRPSNPVKYMKISADNFLFKLYARLFLVFIFSIIASLLIAICGSELTADGG